MRGIIEVAFLEAVEAAYIRRYGTHTRLHDVFDLVGGTSTGALIATAVSLGQPLERIRDFYLRRAKNLFSRRRWWNLGRAPVFDCATLEKEIRNEVGTLTLGDPRLKTLLAIITKRLDTGAPWILNNIPTAPYFNDPSDFSYHGNRHFELTRLLRATTAAPFYFSQQVIEIDGQGTKGVFVDGGLSSYNDPSLALLRLARMRAFGLRWRLGPEHLFVLSIGTGRARKRVPAAKAASMRPWQLVRTIFEGMIADTEHNSLIQMEWMGTSALPSQIDSEVGTLADDCLADAPLFGYQRLDLPLDPDDDSGLSAADAAAFAHIDDPDIIEPLYRRAQDYAARHWDLDELLS